MRFYELISIILHPLGIPTLCVLIYFTFISNNSSENSQVSTLGLVFMLTYVIPLLLLIVLKRTGQVKNLQFPTIKERRFSVLLMIALFCILAKVLIRSSETRALGILFYGASLSLLTVYLLFSIRIKSSLHLLSMGNTVGFFLIFNHLRNPVLLPMIVILLLLSGLLASARLRSGAHTLVEVLVGFFLGFTSQLIVSSAL